MPRFDELTEDQAFIVVQGTSRREIYLTSTEFETVPYAYGLTNWTRTHKEWYNVIDKQFTATYYYRSTEDSALDYVLDIQYEF